MAIRIAWGNEGNTLLVHVYEGTWTLDDFSVAVRQTNALLDSVNHKVNIILDMRASGLFPKGMLSAVRMLAQNPHRNNGIMVMVGCNTFMRVFYDTFMKLFPQRGVKQIMYMAANDEDAQAIFARYGDTSTDVSGQPAHH